MAEEQNKQDKKNKKVSSLEQLDRLVKYPLSKEWLALLVTGLIIIVFMLWVVYGSVEYVTTGTGIIIHEGETYNIQASYEGQIDSIYVKLGDYIQRNHPIALIHSTEISNELFRIDRKISLLKKQKEDFSKLEEELLVLKTKKMENDRKNYEIVIEHYRKGIYWAKEMSERFSILKDKKTISELDYHSFMQDFQNMKKTLADLYQLVGELENKKVELYTDLKKEELQHQLDIDDKIIDLETSRENLDSYLRVKSSHSGEVISIQAKEGDFVDKNQSIATLRLKGSRYLMAYVFFSDDFARIVAPGMTVRITPSSVKKERYGSMLGIISSVDTYPATPEQLKNIFNNPAIVNKVLNMGASYIANVKLEIADTPSGYMWTSSEGPEFEIKEGTFCSAEVTVFKASPLSVFFSIAKKYILGVGDVEKINSKSKENES